ncbi:transposon Ty3-I Gag-Pol polyprotein [Trichonephila inaurata madagascariensis]|uniref:RNA-directed DNA polymerase n=1 Tax=Trichonephila inaurata madagascariensis TaxID=2747483 RepID=A0A8X6XLF8_9ARAC|nr:transposon Ty3-I Gag-Pol polyprotein [Trichonephila inaurata madagascariensis]
MTLQFVGYLGFAKTYDRIRTRFFWSGLYRSVRRLVMLCRECQRRKSVPQKPPGLLMPIHPTSAPFQRVGIDLLGSSKHRKSTGYHPQTNRLTERFNKTVADMLSMYINVEQTNWDEILPFVTFAYNTVKQETTGYTPFYLLHGREAETKLDTVFSYIADGSEDYVSGLIVRAEESRHLSRIRTLEALHRNKTKYDARHRRVSYLPGELVWVFTPVRKVGLSEKLLKLYFGPCRVVRKISYDIYEVEELEPSPRRRKSTQVMHVLRMKKYYTPEAHTGTYSNK